MVSLAPLTSLPLPAPPSPTMPQCLDREAGIAALTRAIAASQVRGRGGRGGRSDAGAETGSSNDPARLPAFPPPPQRQAVIDVKGGQLHVKMAPSHIRKGVLDDEGASIYCACFRRPGRYCWCRRRLSSHACSLTSRRLTQVEGVNEGGGEDGEGRLSLIN